MKKVVEISAKIIFILGLIGIVFGSFSHEKMITIYSIGVMAFGFLLIIFAINNFKIDLKKE